MDDAEFRRFLKQRGKKEHVADELVRQVGHCATYLASESGSGLDTADTQAIQTYADACEASQAGSARELLRALALYFQFTGNGQLALAASQLREQRIAMTRKPFRLQEFRGVDSRDVVRLKAMGIANADQMLAAGSTPADREALAHRTRIAPQVILEYVKLSDLSRIPGLKGVRARLYYDGGFDTLDRIAAADPQALRAVLVAFVERTGFEGIPPLPKEARNTVAVARSLPRIVQY